MWEKETERSLGHLSNFSPSLHLVRLRIIIKQYKDRQRFGSTHVPLRSVLLPLLLLLLLYLRQSSFYVNCYCISYQQRFKIRRIQHSCFNFVVSVDVKPLENIQPKFVALSCKDMKPQVPSTTPGTGFLNIRVLFKNSYKIFKNFVLAIQSRF